MLEDQEARWRMSVRVNYQNENLFKSKLVSPNEFIMHLPRLKAIETFDLDLNVTHKTYSFSTQIQAIEQIKLPHGIFLAAGCKTGAIELQHSQTKQQYQLKSPQPISISRRMINDMLDLGNGRLINCYNQGAIAIWDLSQPLSNDIQPLSYQTVHNSFTYKIRRIDDETVLTCSNDLTAKLYDLQTTTVTQTFHHDSPIWCAYPLNPHVFASAGLGNRLLFWDTRSHRIIQKCELQHEETSYITHLDPNTLIFGDSYQLVTCDLRKTVKQLFGSQRMKTSAQTILITEKGVVAAGRGGDVCLFKKGTEELQIEERSIGQVFVPNFMNRVFGLPFLQRLQQLQNALPNFGMGLNLVEQNNLHQQEEEDMNLMEEQEGIVEEMGGIEEEIEDNFFDDIDSDQQWEDQEDEFAEEQQIIPINQVENPIQQKPMPENLIKQEIEQRLQQPLQQSQIQAQILQPTQPKQLNDLPPNSHTTEQPHPHKE